MYLDFDFNETYKSMLNYQRFKFLCKLYNIKYIDIAKAVGISRATISHYISGDNCISKKTEEALFEYVSSVVG